MTGPVADALIVGLAAGITLPFFAVMARRILTTFPQTPSRSGVRRP
jgi:hypothetical protein